MTLEYASVPLRSREAVRCVECDLVAETAFGWKACLGGGFEGEPVEVVVYCPACAEREVGETE
jgi:hypothetical protein